jgi:hypothetical protein
MKLVTPIGRLDEASVKLVLLASADVKLKVHGATEEKSAFSGNLVFRSKSQFTN